ncbi:hypothetical protein GCM10010191_73890 [Actinomadura vinacea]|uniref:Uncharacterized protein n=1 Tax=Actinomadura vinacea TaxID=115336 RepID=A0ABN3K1L5_9ACTN
MDFSPAWILFEPDGSFSWHAAADTASVEERCRAGAGALITFPVAGRIRLIGYRASALPGR